MHLNVLPAFILTWVKGFFIALQQSNPRPLYGLHFPPRPPGATMTQVKPIVPLAMTVAALLGAPVAQAADPVPAPASASATAPTAPATWDGALMGGKVSLDLRYRFEEVDQDGFDRDAYASTLRTRLGYQTGEWNGLSATLQAANVLVVGQYTLYNSTTNGVTNRPVVADPKYTEINQAYLQYKYGSFAAIGGRQVINLDNQRFVGNVGWRQNDQTFDAVTLKSGIVPRTQLFYSYLGNVNRVTGPDNGALPADLSGDTSLLNAKVDLGAVGSLVLFDYLLKFDDADNFPAAVSENLSSNSYGVLYAGNHAFSETTKLNWSGSWARQSDSGDSTLNYDADYYLLEGGVTVGSYGLKIGYEVLGGNDQPGTTGFQTPLATLHAFQGWADKFTTTPQAGVEDFYVGGSAGFGDLALQLVWHDFQAESRIAPNLTYGSSYGSEWDASAGYKFGAKKRYEALAKFASYQADEFATDTTKFWLQFTATF
jgi:hypothetical protein